MWVQIAMTVYNQNNENGNQMFYGRVNEINNHLVHEYMNNQNLIKIAQNAINLQNEYRFLNEAPIRYFIQRFENIGIYYLENPLNIVFYLGFMIGLYNIYYRNRWNNLGQRLLPDIVNPQIEQLILRLKRNTNSGYHNQRNLRFLTTFYDFYRRRMNFILGYHDFFSIPIWIIKRFWKRK